ncbi:hypothetical protein ABTH27_20050, partial [Acinetobacter baumannii]
LECLGYDGTFNNTEAFEYMLLDTSYCPSTMQAVTPYNAGATFNRDFDGVCPANQSLQWTTFDWQSVTPLDSSIAVSVRTADTEAGLDS